VFASGLPRALERRARSGLRRRCSPVRFARGDIAGSRGATRAAADGVRVWVCGALISQLGDAAMYFALGWAASAHGGTAAGLVLSGIVLPRTALLLVGGVTGDRLGARRVMITGDAVMLVVAVVLGFVAWRSGTPLPLLVTAALIIGIVDAFYLPSSGSMPRRLVNDSDLARAVALRQSGAQLVAMIGGPIGGLVVAAAGFAAAAWGDAVTFAVALVVLIAIRARVAVPPVEPRSSVLRDIRDGLRVVATSPGLRPALLLVAGAAGFILPVTSLLVPLLARAHGWGAGAAGRACQVFCVSGRSFVRGGG
jgi:MFS family permease